MWRQIFLFDQNQLFCCLLPLCISRKPRNAEKSLMTSKMFVESDYFPNLVGMSTVLAGCSCSHNCLHCMLFVLLIKCILSFAFSSPYYTHPCRLYDLWVVSRLGIGRYRSIVIVLFKINKKHFFFVVFIFSLSRCAIIMINFMAMKKTIKIFNLHHSKAEKQTHIAITTNG